MLPELIDRDNRQHFVADGDFMDSENIGAGHFASTGLADELSPAAIFIAGAIGDIMADNDQLQASLAEMPWTLEEAKATLEENAPRHAFGLRDSHAGYAGLPFGMFAEISSECEIRVVPLDEKGHVAKGCDWPTFKAATWRDAVNACLSALFPNPQAA